jgi:hypothetical protein
MGVYTIEEFIYNSGFEKWELTFSLLELVLPIRTLAPPGLLSYPSWLSLNGWDRTL